MLRIGILIRDYKTLENWELRIIENIENDPNLELTLLIKDRRIREDQINSKQKLSEYILNKQILIEKKRYLCRNKTVDKNEIFKYLNTIPSINVNPNISGDKDIFSKEDSQKIRKYDLDLILKHGFNIVDGEILNAVKYGIWFLSHSDLSLKRGGLPGFWEVLLKEPIVTVYLFQLNKEGVKGNIIDKAYYNRSSLSSVITNNIIKESSVSLLLKYLKKLAKNENIITNKTVDLRSSKKSPNLYYIGNYLFNFYRLYVKNKIKNIVASSDVREQCWTLFIGKGNFMDSDLTKLKPVQLPKDEFWADPFLFNYKNEYYVFFENYSYRTGLGKISCGKVENNELVDIVDVLDLDYHLSYPFIFEEDNQIYMIPETGQNKQLEVYRCVNFPNKWALYSTAFDGEVIQDTTLFIDKANQKWLFLNKVSSPNMDRTSELYIYQIDSLQLKNIKPHRQNPVIIDSRVGRNGGAIFERQGKIYRPSQSNTDGIYGRSLNINQIKKLTIDEYKEEIIKKVEPNFKNNLVSIHHLHQIDGKFVFDAAYKQL